jgi:hypothetical protein
MLLPLKRRLLAQQALRELDRSAMRRYLDVYADPNTLFDDEPSGARMAPLGFALQNASLFFVGWTMDLMRQALGHDAFNAPYTLIDRQGHTHRVTVLSHALLWFIPHQLNKSYLLESLVHNGADPRRPFYHTVDGEPEPLHGEGLAVALVRLAPRACMTRDLETLLDGGATFAPTDPPGLLVPLARHTVGYMHVDYMEELTALMRLHPKAFPPAFVRATHPQTGLNLLHWILMGGVGCEMERMERWLLDLRGAGVSALRPTAKGRTPRQVAAAHSGERVQQALDETIRSELDERHRALVTHQVLHALPIPEDIALRIARYAFPGPLFFQGSLRLFYSQSQRRRRAVLFSELPSCAL